MNGNNIFTTCLFIQGWWLLSYCTLFRVKKQLGYYVHSDRSKTYGLFTVLVNSQRIAATFNNLFFKSLDHFLWTYWGNKLTCNVGRAIDKLKACKSQDRGEWFTSFSRILPTSMWGYYAGKLLENVVYCFYNQVIVAEDHWSSDCGQHPNDFQ